MRNGTKTAARMTAEERFSQIKRQEKLALKERQKAEQEASDKMTRLRTLRLAKEAEDKKVADQEAVRKTLEKLVSRRRKPTPKVA